MCIRVLWMVETRGCSRLENSAMDRGGTVMSLTNTRGLQSIEVL